MQYVSHLLGLAQADAVSTGESAASNAPIVASQQPPPRLAVWTTEEEIPAELASANDDDFAFPRSLRRAPVKEKLSSGP